MNEDISLTFDLPAVARKKVSAAFDGGRITSDGGVMLLAQAERRLGIADQLARVIPDERDADPDILRARIFAIACGYEDADDLDRLRSDPAFKLACSRLPDTGRALCSQPTVSRRECAYLARSYPPDVVMVDYGRPEVMEWCDENGVDFIFGPPGNAVLDSMSMRPPTTFAPAAHSTRNPACEASPRHAGKILEQGAPCLRSHLARPPRRVSISVSSLPASRRDRRSCRRGCASRATRQRSRSRF